MLYGSLLRLKSSIGDIERKLDCLVVFSSAGVMYYWVRRRLAGTSDFVGPEISLRSIGQYIKECIETQICREDLP